MKKKINKLIKNKVSNEFNNEFSNEISSQISNNIINELNHKNRNEARAFKAFQTSAISEIDNRLLDSRVSIPSERSIIEAKEWVDHNIK